MVTVEVFDILFTWGYRVLVAGRVVNTVQPKFWSEVEARRAAYLETGVW